MNHPKPFDIRRWAGIGLAVLALPLAAAAQQAYTRNAVSLRAGPSGDYPLVARLAPGQPVDVIGCTRGYRWCDVVLPDGGRGWVWARSLDYAYPDRRVPLAVYGASIGVPLVTFVIGNYWGSYYRDRPWYGERRWWGAAPPPPVAGWHPPPPMRPAWQPRPWSPGRDFRPSPGPGFRPPADPGYRPPADPGIRPPRPQPHPTFRSEAPHGMPPPHAAGGWPGGERQGHRGADGGGRGPRDDGDRGGGRGRRDDGDRGDRGGQGHRGGGGGHHKD